METNFKKLGIYVKNGRKNKISGNKATLLSEIESKADINNLKRGKIIITSTGLSNSRLN
jgi:hypothetical protein